LGQAGPGGALVLARAFDSVRGALKLSIVRRLDPADVLALNGNAVASLAHSVSKLAQNPEGSKADIPTEFLKKLGPVQSFEHAEIDPTDRLEVGDLVFHASWGSGTVIAPTDETATIDFGSAGTRVLLRSIARLRRG
jgi:hypothetical protein